MGTATLVEDRGRFALVRYVPDVVRGEARNVAVILMTDSGFRSVRASPPSAIRGQLRDQGILDGLLMQLARDVISREDLGSGWFREWSDLATGALQVSEVRNASVVGDPNDTMEALYRALVAPRSRRSNRLGKSELIDQVVRSFRGRGAQVRRSDYHQGFLFDAIVEQPAAPSLTVEALSFATGAQDWSNVERDAGHFLYARRHVSSTALCVLQPPGDRANAQAVQSWSRVAKWLTEESVRVIAPAGLSAAVADLMPIISDGSGSLPLPLVMA